MLTKRTRRRVPMNAMARAETALIVVATTPKSPEPRTTSAHAARMEAALAVQARKESSL